MSDIEDDIKATAGAIAADASRITSIEDRKIELDGDDPELQQLSDEAVQVAEDMLHKATIERELVVEANRQA